MPNHVVPTEYYLIIPFKINKVKQSSLVTIFSIWNTMMGTSILTMPWALEQAGFSCGIVLMVAMAVLALYTAYRIMKSPHSDNTFSNMENVEFSDVCRVYLGGWAEIVSLVFSLIALLGAAVVYWVLMSNFLYHSVTFIHDKATSDMNATNAHGINNFSYDVHCILPSTNTSTNVTSMFDRVWQQDRSVPLLLVVVLFPLVNFRSPTFFTKLNSLGVVAVAYVIVFVSAKAGFWGIHMHASMHIPEFQWTFPALTGILSLGYFIHNGVITIVRNQRNPQHNGRDLTIAYICVALTYITVAIMFYTCFPLPKNCIEDNLLNNFSSSDAMAFVARLFLFFQIGTVFPLLLYIFRIQLFARVFGTIYPGLKQVVILNVLIITVCVLMAMFLPKIGTIIRFSGALCGLVYIFALPCVVYLVARRRHTTLGVAVVVVHVAIIVAGVLNFVAQFVIVWVH